MANEAPKAEQAAKPQTAAGKPAKAVRPNKGQPVSGLEMVLLRNNFYRDNFRRMVTLCLFLLVIMAGLVGYLYYQWLEKPLPTYFATTTDGKLFQMEPMERPFLNEAQLNQWVVEAAVAAYSYNFVNYREALQEVKQYFTENGYRQFLDALKTSRNLEAVQTKKLVSTAVATGAPVIVNQGILNNAYAWRIQLPMKVTYQSANELIPQNIIVTILVTRVPIWQSAKGVAIESFVVREGRVTQ